MPFSGNNWEMSKLVSYKEMLNVIQNSYPNLTPLCGQTSDVAKFYLEVLVSVYVGLIGEYQSHSMINDHKMVSLVEILRKFNYPIIDQEGVIQLEKLNSNNTAELNTIYDQLDKIVNQSLTKKSASHKGKRF
ncbi:unnamed protein product [Trichobilharzia regenti]|nr:unnamed protein product [Trichobilharzia regenti]